MEKIDEIMKKIMSRGSGNISELDIQNMTEKEKSQQKVDWLNQDEGDLDKSIYDCPICKNKGEIYFVDERSTGFYEVARDCKCKAIRNSIIRMKRSGLEPIIKKCTFDKYETTEEWQKKAKEKAIGFADKCEALEHKCFYIGGGVGAGKTHLCTAIARELLLKGKRTKYMLWVNESAKLKSAVNDPEYGSMLDEYRTVDVLYIDDFFKITKDNYGHELYPTAADIRLAYEIINYRYQRSELITIISSERFIDEIEEIDSAVGSRIIEMAEDNVLNISKDKSRNYRLRKREVL